jgi:hypothetical protein
VGYNHQAEEREAHKLAVVEIVEEEHRLDTAAGW